MGFGSNFFSGGSRGGGRGASGNKAVVEFTLHGDRELLRALKELGKVPQLSIKKALDAGAGVIKQAVIDNALKVKDTGLLAKSIKVAHRRMKYPGTLMAVVGPTHMKRMMRRTKKGKLRTVSSKKVGEYQARGETLVPYDPGNYGHLVEHGTKPHHIGPETKKAISIQGGHPIRGGVWHPGFEGIGFMRRAVDAHSRAALARVNQKLLKEINAIVARNRVTSA